MPLSPGTRLGPYEIVALLGAGGMGEVYRARDTRLKRDIAIKVLPSEFAADPERLARFRREAELLATLNHPNIAVVHGLEDTDGSTAIVMELVEGESLAEKLGSSRALGLGNGESIAIARQICDALETAHDRGIVHRDLKPGNIMLTHDGQVKVLDFGLARIEAGAGGTSEPGALTHSPTLTFAGTQAGLILGTAAYMSPEQAKGRLADKRSDVWAFGCVLYEMLTQTRAFDGEDVSEVLAAVLKSEPDWTALPRNVPAPVRRIVQQCLTKDRKARIPDISVVRFLFDDANTIVNAPALSGERGWSAIAWKIAAVLLLGTPIAGFVGWRAARSAPSPVARFHVFPPDKGGTFVVSTAGSPRAAPHAVISPDGRTLAFSVKDSLDRVSLWVRPVESIEAHPLAGTDGASYPFWSPDSRFIAYFAGGKLMKISAAGGPAQTLCAGAGRGGAWGRDGVIVFNGGPGPLARVSSSGGTPVALSQELGTFPSFLPDGRHVLFYSGERSGDREAFGVFVIPIEGGTARRLVDSDSGGIYSSTGHLLFVRQNTLLAQRFNPKTLLVSDDPFPVAEHVQTGIPLGHVSFSVSDNGVLAYGVASTAIAPSAQLTWLDRQGRPTQTLGQPEEYRSVDLSPDGSRLAVHRHVGSREGDLWLLGSGGGAASRFTFDQTHHDSSPIWSPDGATVAFDSFRGGKFGVYTKASSGAIAEQRLIESNVGIVPTSWSPDGRTIICSTLSGVTNTDLVSLEVAGGHKTTPLITTRFSEVSGQVSPDGRWLAYLVRGTQQVKP